MRVRLHDGGPCRRYPSAALQNPVGDDARRDCRVSRAVGEYHLAAMPKTTSACTLGAARSAL